uniref:VWFA domain-containing protein n=1 Tax=Arcella intermedia TaxID=1963864 RepID=A0A6B2KX57_9EUKA
MFLIDTSASMNQRAGNGFTFLDCAKSAVERFISVRSRNANSRSDRYFLVTCAEGNAAVKVGWKNSHYHNFTKVLKTLVASDLSDLGSALKVSFDLLNQYRLLSGIDTYGQGRRPWSFEPAMIIMLTDGSSLTNINGVKSEFTLPMQNLLPGSPLTIEPFRWDQRLFSIQMQMQAMHLKPGDPSASVSEPGDLRSPSLAPMCEVTGGSLFSVYSMKQLLMTMDTLADKAKQLGVMVRFSPSPSSSSGVSDPTMLTPITNYGSWPIPEEFWVNSTLVSLPGRRAQPVISYKVTPFVVPSPPNEAFPMDCYLVEPGAVADGVSKLIGGTNNGLAIHMQQASPDGSNSPFGFLKCSPNGVLLYVLPCNFPVLFSVLKEYNQLIAKKAVVPSSWRQSFENYLKSVPSYYYSFLKAGLSRSGIVGMPPIPDESGLSYALEQQLKDLKNKARIEADKKEASRAMEGDPTNQDKESTTSYETKQDTILTGAADASTFLDTLIPEKPSDYSRGASRLPTAKEPTEITTNVFDIPRNQLFQELHKLRQVVFAKTMTCLSPGALTLPPPSPLYPAQNTKQPRNNLPRFSSKPDTSPRFNLPVSEMGNYQEYLNKQPKLRSVFEDHRPQRQNMFGSPYRLKKIHKFMKQLGTVDEAEMNISMGDEVGGISDLGFREPPKSDLPASNTPKEGEKKRKISQISKSNISSISAPLTPSAVATSPTSSPLPSPPVSPLPQPSPPVSPLPQPSPPTNLNPVPPPLDVEFCDGLDLNTTIEQQPTISEPPEPTIPTQQQPIPIHEENTAIPIAIAISSLNSKPSSTVLEMDTPSVPLPTPLPLLVAPITNTAPSCPTTVLLTTTIPKSQSATSSGEEMYAWQRIQMQFKHNRALKFKIVKFLRKSSKESNFLNSLPPRTNSNGHLNQPSLLQFASNTRGRNTMKNEEIGELMEIMKEFSGSSNDKVSFVLDIIELAKMYKKLHLVEALQVLVN